MHLTKFMHMVKLNYEVKKVQNLLKKLYNNINKKIEMHKQKNTRN